MTHRTQPAVHHVALTVSDVEASIAWYERIFGIRYQVDIPHDGGVGKLLANEDRSLMFVLHHHDANDGGLFNERVTGLDHVGLAVTTRRELEDWEAHLEEQGIVLADEAAKPSTRSPIIDAPYASVIVFRDPDNIQLELFAPAATRESVN